MLTLQRKEGEITNIKHNNEDLNIIITMAKNGRIKLSFNGPKSFEILREEIIESKSATNQ